MQNGPQKSVTSSSVIPKQSSSGVGTETHIQTQTSSCSVSDRHKYDARYLVHIKTPLMTQTAHQYYCQRKNYPFPPSAHTAIHIPTPTCLNLPFKAAALKEMSAGEHLNPFKYYEKQPDSNSQ